MTTNTTGGRTKPAVMSPNGSPIVGTLETLLGVARASVTWNGIAMEVESHTGTEIVWDTQQTVKRNGQTVYVDEDGEEWTEDQLRAPAGWGWFLVAGEGLGGHYQVQVDDEWDRERERWDDATVEGFVREQLAAMNPMAADLFDAAIRMEAAGEANGEIVELLRLYTDRVALPIDPPAGARPARCGECGAGVAS